MLNTKPVNTFGQLIFKLFPHWTRNLFPQQPDERETPQGLVGSPPVSSTRQTRARPYRSLIEVCELRHVCIIMCPTVK